MPMNKDRTYAVASGFGPLLPNAGETGCHISQYWGSEGPMRKSYKELQPLVPAERRMLNRCSRGSDAWLHGLFWRD
jgi:hypothetical protein